MASRLFRVAACAAAVWVVARVVFWLFPGQDAIAAMLLLLCVLAIATLGDRVLAVATSLAASISFSYFFIDTTNSFSINSTEGAVAFVGMLVTALTGSQLSLGIQTRAAESERRRGEMQKLQQLGAILLTTDTVTEAAGKALQEIVAQFGGGAILRVDGLSTSFHAGVTGGADNIPIVVHTPNNKGLLELYGMKPSVEVRSALVNLLGLMLDRAAAAEERSGIESAQRGEELRNTILNALAHNFRTPLTCIKAAASMMRGSDGVPGAYSRELVEVIDEEADRLDALIRDSLDLARIQSRQANPRVEDCSIAIVVAGVLEKMKRYLTRQMVIVQIPEDLPGVRGDRFLLEQMVTQVLDNAWKYAAVGARIWVSACQAGEEVMLTIRNEGNPIPDEERNLVFDRFYRGARSRASVEGTGLGLAIARTIAEAHGGRVWLETATEGPVFRFALPAGTREEVYDREPHYIAH
jgi:two-component system, OmpR family, sensor histidine kinase KdpD